MHSNDDITSRSFGGKVEPNYLRVTVLDDTLSPVLAAGQTVLIDSGDQALVGGAIYGVRAAGGLSLRLFVPGFAGIGCRLGMEAIGMLACLGGPLRWQGPVPLGRLQLVGRVVEPSVGGLAMLARQQRLLTALRESTRTSLLAGDTSPFAEPAGESVETIVESLATTLIDGSAADRFAMEQRLDAIDARLALLDELIADRPAEGLADAVVKLETLAALQPSGSCELEPRLLGSALDALRRHVSDFAQADPGAATQSMRHPPVQALGRVTESG